MNGPPKPDLRKVFIDTTRQDLEIAWKERLEESKVLDQAGFHSTAAAMRLYSLEMLVKLVICKHLDLEQLPSACKTHNLVELVIYTGLWKELHEDPTSRLGANWARLVIYSQSRLNNLRYEPRVKLSDEDALEIREAFDGPADNPEDGVATWLSKHT